MTGFGLSYDILIDFFRALGPEKNVYKKNRVAIGNPVFLVISIGG